MKTIDTEAAQRINIPIDIDFFGDRYQTTNSLYTFTSPSLWTLEKNLFFLLKNSIEVDLEPQYVRKPWLLSYEYYGTVILEYLILYVNGILSPEDFDIKSVVLPNMDSIIEVCGDKFSKKEDPNLMEKITW